MKYALQVNLNVEMPFLKKANVVLGQHVLTKHGHFKKGFDKPRAIRRYLPRKQAKLVRDQLPEPIKHGLIAVNLTEIRLLAPHVHTVESSVINFYLETKGERTVFWEGDVIPDDSEVTDNGNSYWNISKDRLTEVEHFVAKPFDVWVLDTRQPHSVEYVDDTRESALRYEPMNHYPRIIMQAFMSLPFVEVVSAFEGNA